jgi:hypothetical protein
MAETTTYYRVRTGTARSRNDCQCYRTAEGCPPVTGAPLTAGAPAGSQHFGTGAEDFWSRKKRSGVDDCSYGINDYYRLCLRQYDLAEESIEDGCQALAADPACAQWDEIADGVKVFENFNPTGLAPLPSTRTFSGIGLHPIERNWWVKQRAYLCTTGAAPYDFSAAATRFGHVVSSLDDAGGAPTRYEDLRSDSGTGGPQSWTPVAASFDTGALGGALLEDCELACKTQRQTEDYQAGVAGVAAQMQTDPQRFDIIYHACRNGVCPAGPGETIVQDCACLNEFTQAALMMQAMRLAGQDTICTSGTPNPIPPSPAAPQPAAP